MRVFIKIIVKVRMLYWMVIYSGFRKKYNLSDDFRFNGANILLYGDGVLCVGCGSYVGENSTIQLFNDCKVIIGRRCRISHNVRIYTQSAVADQDFMCSPIETYSCNVSIGDGCWIGANVFINPGVSIGDNSIVGANSVVTKNVPQNQIWGGVPARFIREKIIN